MKCFSFLSFCLKIFFMNTCVRYWSAFNAKLYLAVSDQQNDNNVTNLTLA